MQFNVLNVFHNVNITVSTKKNVLMFYHFNKIMWMGKGHWSTLITQVYLSLKRTHSIFMITSQGQRCMDDFFFFFLRWRCTYKQPRDNRPHCLPNREKETGLTGVSAATGGFRFATFAPENEFTRLTPIRETTCSNKPWRSEKTTR